MLLTIWLFASGFMLGVVVSLIIGLFLLSKLQDFKPFR